MAWQGVEIEIEVPCAGGQKHPVRLRFTGWGEYEVAYNPVRSCSVPCSRVWQPAPTTCTSSSPKRSAGIPP
jgi:hypothetical protein